MKAIHALFVATVSFAGIAQASEITDFPLESSTVSRESVRWQALAARQANQARQDISGPVVVPMSSRSRDEVRQEAASSLKRVDTAAMDHIGGM